MAELRQNPALVCMKKTQAGALKMNYRSRKSILTSQHNDKRQELLREEEKIKGLHLMYQLAVTNKQLNGRVRKAKKKKTPSVIRTVALQLSHLQINMWVHVRVHAIIRF